MATKKSVLILIPSFNDWDAVRLLLPRIDSAMAAPGLNSAASNTGWKASVLVVDDASNEPLPDGWPDASLSAIDSVSVLHLRCNLGHQRAIALGLYHAHEFTGVDAVLVMDGDGEDRAEDIPVLLEEFERSGETSTIFAARTRRMESWAFQFFYRAYKIVHLVLTGVEVRVGNFSVLPRLALTRLMAVSDLWNNYSAAVFRARLPRRLVPLARGTRLAGASRMNFVSLLTHGLSALSVYSEHVSARFLAAAAGLGAIALGLLAWTAGTWALTGEAPSAAMRLVVTIALGLAIPSIAAAVLFAFAIVSRRNGTNFLLLRDAPHFLLGSRVMQANADLHALGLALGGRERSVPNPAGVKAGVRPGAEAGVRL